jgi:N-acetylglucosamine kinase-like BadF-type ATPase
VTKSATGPGSSLTAKVSVRTTERGSRAGVLCRYSGQVRLGWQSWHDQHGTLLSCVLCRAPMGARSLAAALHSRQRCSATPPFAGRIAYSLGMRCVLGFDGGGTKTDCVLMDESRQILARTRSGPSNPTRVGLEGAFAALLEAAEKALTASGVLAIDILSINGGIAGLGAANLAPALFRMLESRFRNARITLQSDLSMALAATLEIPSVVVIAGTGSAVIGRNAPDHLMREGGWGPTLGDPGSAYDIGRKATVLSLRHWVQGQNSPLGNEILHLFHCNWVELQDQIRANADGVFAKVFPIVARAANEGDTSARALLQSAADDLSQLLAPVVENLGLRERSFFLAKTGGVFGRSPFFDAPFDALATKIAPHARIGPLPEPIADFAARAAVDCLDSPVRNVGS